MRAYEQGGTAAPISDAERLRKRLAAGEITYDQLTDKGRALLLHARISAGEVKMDDLSEKGFRLLRDQGYQVPSAFEIRKRTIEANIGAPLPTAADIMRPLKETETSLKGGVGETIRGAGAVASYLGGKVGKPQLGKPLQEYGAKIAEKHYQEPVEWQGWRTFLNPSFYTRNVARTVPTTAALAGPALLTGGATAGLGTIGGAITAGTMNRVMESAMEAGGVYEEALAKGMSREQADDAADRAFRENLKLVGLDVGEFAAAFLPGMKATTKLGKIAITTGGLAAAGGQEALEEALQERATRKALGEEFSWRDPRTQEAAAIGGLMGLGLGGAGVSVDHATEVQKAAAAKLPEEQRLTLNTAIAERMAQGKTWAVAASEAMTELSETNPVIEKAVRDAVQEVGARLPTPDQQARLREQTTTYPQPPTQPLPTVDQLRALADERVSLLAEIQVGDRVGVIGEAGEFTVAANPRPWVLTVRDSRGNVREVSKDVVIPDYRVLRERAAAKKAPAAQVAEAAPAPAEAPKLVEEPLAKPIEVAGQVVPQEVTLPGEKVTGGTQKGIVSSPTVAPEATKGVTPTQTTPTAQPGVLEAPGAKQGVSRLTEAEQAIYDQLRPHELMMKAQIEKLIREEMDYLESTMGQGVEPGGLIRDDEGNVTGRFGRQSRNEKWYSDFYSQFGRKPTKAELREIAVRHLERGSETRASEVIPANEDYTELQRALSMLEQLEAKRVGAADRVPALEGEAVASFEQAIQRMAAPKPPAGQGTLTGRQATKGPKPKPVSPPRPAIPRGQPVQVASPVRRSEIVKFLREKLDVPIRVGRYRGKALGIFKAGPEVIRTRLAHDLPVIAHEVGHFLDKQMNLSDPRFDQELMRVGQGTTLGTYTTAQARAEGVAEFMRLYLTDPQRAQQLAPNYYAAFEAKVSLDPEVRDTLLAARDMIHKYENQPDDAYILGHVSVGEKERRPITWDAFYTKVVDELRPLEKAVRALSEGKPLPIGLDPFRRAWLARGWVGMAQRFLERNVIDTTQVGPDGRYKVVGKSLREILEPVKDDLDTLRSYIISRRAIELADRGINPGIEDIDRARAVVAAHPEMEPIHRALVKYQDDVLNMTLVRSGILTPQQAADMRALNKEYVPFYRAFDESGGSVLGFWKGKGFANLPQAIKKIEGSSREIIDPLESIIKNTCTFVQLAEANDVGRLLANLADRAQGGGKWVERITDRTVPAAPGDKVLTPGKDYQKENVLSFFRNGEREYYQVAPELAPALLALDVESVDLLTRIISMPAQVLRAGATLNAGFMVRNPIRDQVDAYMFSKFGFKPGVDFVRGLFHALRKDDLYWDFLSSGGGQASVVSMDRQHLQDSIVDLLKSGKEKARYVAKHPRLWFDAILAPLRYVSELSELGTRVGEFERGVMANPTAEGMLEAALSARDLMDFARHGSDRGLRKYSMWVPFFNAQIQGIDKVGRALRDNPRQFMVRAVTAVTLPTLICYVLARGNNRYKRLDEKEKDLYWHIPVSADPEARLVRIPKPHEVGLLFGSVPERIFAYVDSKDPEAFDELGARLLEETIPNLLPQILVGYMEAKANERYYSGTPIIPEAEKDLPPEQQYGPYTSDTMKWLGNLLKTSPRLMQHYVESYGGGLAGSVLDAMDWVVRRLQGDEAIPKPAIGAEGIPVIGALVTPQSAESGDMDDFYTELERLRLMEKRSQASGEPMTFDDRMRLSRLERATKRLAFLRKQQRSIEDSRTMTPQEKKERLDTLKMQMTDVARMALGKEVLAGK